MSKQPPVDSPPENCPDPNCGGVVREVEADDRLPAWVERKYGGEEYAPAGMTERKVRGGGLKTKFGKPTRNGRRRYRVDQFTHYCEGCRRAWIYDEDGLVTEPRGLEP